MKTKMMIVSLLGIALLGLAACGGAGVASAPAETRTISINGTGIVKLSPDMAEVNIGVQTEADDAQQASAENTLQVNEIIAALQAFEIAETDIQTAYFSIYPMQQYDNEGQMQEIRYVVQNSLLITVRDLNKLGDILDTAIGAGANTINGITFNISDREGAYAQALDAAMANAESRAEVLAQAAGAKIVKMQSVNTYLGGGGIPVMYSADVAAEGLGMGGSSVPVSPGEMEIQVEVNVVYEID